MEGDRTVRSLKTPNLPRVLGPEKTRIFVLE